MEITFRRSHTFEPNYVTPGQDAAISWEQPDFRFVNTSSAPLASGPAMRTAKPLYPSMGSLFWKKAFPGIFILKKWRNCLLRNRNMRRILHLNPEPEKVVKAAVPGSRWDTYKVISKDGEERERILDHSKTYKGHAAVIHRNTASSETSKAEQTPSAAPYETKTGPEHPASSDPAPAETLPSDAPFVDGMPDSYTPKTNPIIF